MTISIIIPAYNEQADIAGCLDAIALQQLAPDEVIVVDNNSTDRTVEIARTYPFVTVIHEERQGVAFARDAGFDAASGDIIGRIDVDTYLPPDWTRRLSRIFADPSVQAVTGVMFYKDMPARQVGESLDRLLRQAVYQHGRDTRFLVGSNMAIRAAAWRTVRDEVCHSPEFHEDVDLAIHLNQHDLRIAFDRELRAGISARRLDDDPQTFYHYIRMTDRACSAHGIASQAVKIPALIYLGAYPGLKLLRQAYDPQTQRFSIHKFLETAEARKGPNDEVA